LLVSVGDGGEAGGGVRRVGDIGVEASGLASEGGADLIGGGRTRDAQDGVGVWHGRFDKGIRAARKCGVRMDAAEGGSGVAGRLVSQS
jgi:hypothetical protein